MSSPITTSPSQPYNYSIHALPLAYALAFPPVMYQFVKGMTASNYSTTNIIPRTNLDSLKAKVDAGKFDAGTWQKLVRARGAHFNALEGWPLFAGAMILGNYAQLDVKEMNLCAAEYIAARVLYTTLYMTVKSEAASYLRTGVYAWSIGIPMYVLWKAGNRLAEKV